MANPRFRDHIPLMIGGSGEKKTIPLAAGTSTISTSSPASTSCRGRSGGRRTGCEEIGRDPATLETSMLVTAMVDDNVTADVIPDD